MGACFSAKAKADAGCVAAANVSMEQCVAYIAKWAGVSLPAGVNLHVDTHVVRDALAGAGVCITWPPYTRIAPPAGVAPQWKVVVASDFARAGPLRFTIVSMQRAQRTTA